MLNTSRSRDLLVVMWVEEARMRVASNPNAFFSGSGKGLETETFLT